MANNQQLLLGEGAGSAPAVYIEDVFSTYLYTGNASTQTITNGIDLSTKGGLVWCKARSNPYDNYLFDTARGANNYLNSNASGAQNSDGVRTNLLTAFNADGFSLGADSLGSINVNSVTYASWTFRKQPKFFDVVTYTGNDTSRSISHSLGSVPGCIMIKNVSSGGFDWVVYHRSNSATDFLKLNTTAAVATNATYFSSAPTSTVFNIGAGGLVNNGGATFVAYLFAHNAGGFGLAGTDNVISCGSFSGGGATVNLGWEPQWILAKRTDTTGNWYIDDNMRGWPAAGSNDNPLLANTADAEPTGYAGFANITSTGFTNNFNGDYIYIAIRRGPMKVPTVGTSVYNAEAFTGTGATRAITTLSAPDMAWIRAYKDYTNANTIQVYDRLRGNGVRLRTGLTNADNTNAVFLQFNNQMLATVGNDSETNGSGALNVAWAFKRAPGFFDEVCYTAVSPAGANVITHNLGVAPELVIAKTRSASPRNWAVVCSYTGFGSSNGYRLNSASAQGNDGPSAVSTTTVTMDMPSDITQAGETQVAYLFATCAGVSKVGTYTGNGSNQTIACGFTAGSRFVLIKRTDSTGDWYVWDSARGIIAGNDPHLSLNDTAAEVTSDDSVDTDNSGFIVNQVAATNVNVTSATYIFLAIA